MSKFTQHNKYLSSRFCLSFLSLQPRDEARGKLLHESRIGDLFTRIWMPKGGQAHTLGSGRGRITPAHFRLGQNENPVSATARRDLTPMDGSEVDVFLLDASHFPRPYRDVRAEPLAPDPDAEGVVRN